jgi:hypothetical protein
MRFTWRVNYCFHQNLSFKELGNLLQLRLYAKDKDMQIQYSITGMAGLQPISWLVTQCSEATGHTVSCDTSL